MKVCHKCNIEQSLDCFYKHKTARDGYQGQCKNCYSINVTRWKNNNIARVKKLDRNAELKREYGITLDDYNILFSEQNGCCAICNIHQSQVKKTLAVDHCHKTGNVRSLLCSNCNMAIGLLKDKPELMIKAAEYINNSVDYKLRLVK